MKAKEEICRLLVSKRSSVVPALALLSFAIYGNSELNAIQNEEIISDLSMQAVMIDIIKLSELLKTGSAYYSNAKSREKELIIKTIFSELKFSGNTLKYKCKNGFKALENRNFLVCDPTAWLSELLRLGEFLKISLKDLNSVINRESK